VKIRIVGADGEVIEVTGEEEPQVLLLPCGPNRTAWIRLDRCASPYEQVLHGYDSTS